ncbi:unnamed protein product [Polarella glacialis]|uniref:Peroxin-5 n=1 Tax=Polarella glacialis TaxID=89957 RepID=A0A813FED6_POLGL|nr:unnamed protein product [Polarella glacialis]
MSALAYPPSPEDHSPDSTPAALLDMFKQLPRLPSNELLLSLKESSFFKGGHQQFLGEVSLPGSARLSPGPKAGLEEKDLDFADLESDFADLLDLGNKDTEKPTPLCSAPTAVAPAPAPAAAAPSGDDNNNNNTNNNDKNSNNNNNNNKNNNNKDENNNILSLSLPLPPNDSGSRSWAWECQPLSPERERAYPPSPPPQATGDNNNHKATPLTPTTARRRLPLEEEDDTSNNSDNNDNNNNSSNNDNNNSNSNNRERTGEALPQEPPEKLPTQAEELSTWTEGGLAINGRESAAEVFARAEELCEARHFAEAAELFRHVLAALRTSPERHALRAVEAEVWAHLGVAMQSLDDIEAAIESYGQAVQLDPGLHVCFANLATLYIYLDDMPNAHEHISRALCLDPRSEAYLDIQRALPPALGVRGEPL